MSRKEIEEFEDDIKETHSIEIQYKCPSSNTNEQEFHKRIHFLRELPDYTKEESLKHYWKILGETNQINFLINLVSYHYFYHYDTTEELFSVEKIDVTQCNFPHKEAQKIVSLLCKYTRQRRLMKEGVEFENFIFELIEIILDRFVMDKEIYIKSKLPKNGVILYSNMSQKEYSAILNNLKEDNEIIIGRYSDSNKIIEEFKFYIYCTYYYHIKKTPFKDLPYAVPNNGIVNDDENRKKLNRVWKSIQELEESS